MAQRVFVRVAGFTDVERHALNTVFRLSEQGNVTYSLWMADAPQPPGLALVDGSSPSAAADGAAALGDGLTLFWIGSDAPHECSRSFERPFGWGDVVQAMDEIFLPAEPLDFDLDFDSVDTQPPSELPDDEGVPPRKALIAAANREARLYMRAKLSLAGWTLADEAETGARALELARTHSYEVVLVDHVPDFVEPWGLITELRQALPSLRSVVLIKRDPNLVQRLRGHMLGARIFDKPPDPGRLHQHLFNLRR